MRENRRIRRMERNRKKIPGLNLTSLMDVFTILVFFLLANSSSSEVLATPKQITLPDSVVEAKPRETVVIMVSPTTVLVQGESVVNTPDLLVSTDKSIPAITQRLSQLEQNIIGISTKEIVESKEITVLADKTIPFKVLKKIMLTCTASGYGKISLAVIQKASQN
ncbi:biopolymer transporter ExbD [uncultured Desulfuromusa sp.]|uniref:ExbD/TolR family protein n=1 Tax=uncultured Desulfuromusa sp. TaxID=219183 RepID=UPI002AA80C91|nr:biopolymer transporter ExbD [uncultured Desulfuromusa sp.]